MDFVQQVIECGLFAGMTDDQENLLLELVEVQELEEGKELLREGSSARLLYVLWNGRVGIFKMGPSDILVVTCEKPGTIFGEVTFLRGGTCTASVRTLAPSRVLLFQQDALARVIREQPELGSLVIRNIAAITALKLAETFEHVDDAAFVHDVADTLSAKLALVTQHVRDEHGLAALRRILL